MNASITYENERVPAAPKHEPVKEKVVDRRPPPVPASGVLVRVNKTEIPDEFPLGTVLLMYRAGKAHVVKHKNRDKLGALVSLAPRRGEPPCPISVEPIPAGEKVEVE